jgi:hypothetical protein
LQTLEMNSPTVLAAYEEMFTRKRLHDPKAASVIVAAYYESGNHVEPRGGNEMLGDRWTSRERLAGILQWAIPAALLALAAMLLQAGRRTGATASTRLLSSWLHNVRR